MVYLDHAATTPLAPEVLEAMQPFLRDNFGNPSGLHAVARDAGRSLQEARQRAGFLLGTGDESQIVFTSGGTESNNLAILGLQRRRGLHAIVGAIEHKSALLPTLQLKRHGLRVDQLSCDPQGRYRSEDLAKLIRAETALIVLGLANSELGTIQDIPALTRLKEGAHFHCDAVAAGGKLDIRVNDLGVDSLSLSAHKFYGPKGTGLLYMRRPGHHRPLFFGGGQESELRSGTQNVAGVAGLVAALDLCEQNQEAEWDRQIELRELLWEGLVELCPGIRRLGPGARPSPGGGLPLAPCRAGARPSPGGGLPGLLSVLVPERNGETLALQMSHRGVALSSGSACSTLHPGPSHVIQALGLNPKATHGHLRFSMGRGTQRGHIEKTLAAFGETYVL